MATPNTMSDLSVTAATNSPAGSESPTSGDDFLRAIQAILRRTNAKGSDIASATTTDIGAATAEFVDVTGTTTITGLGTVDSGIVRTVRFTGALILTHNGTSLILPGSANITTAANDVAIFRSLGSGNWLCVAYKKQSGEAISSVPFSDSTAIIKGSSDATKLVRFEVDGLTTATTRVLTVPNKDITIAGLTDVSDKIQSIDATVSANALTVTVNPTIMDFRSATLSIGTVNTRTLSVAASLVVPSGATLGTINNVTSRLAILLIDNAGTLEAAITNLAGGVNLDETGVITTTALSTGSDSSNVVYSTNARTSVAYRVVGFVESTQTTAGTWATAPSTIQGCGGQAFTGMSSIGYGQTWQTVTRTASTTYYNTTGKPIMLNLYGSSASGTVNLTVGGVVVAQMVYANTGGTLTAIIPNNVAYSYSGAVSSAVELR